MVFFGNRNGTFAEIIADSENPDGKRITTFVLNYPRYVHSEVMTHRCFSKNAASSRAVPVDKFMRQVLNNPVIPQRWGLNGRGMQDHGEIAGEQADKIRQEWLEAASLAVGSASKLADLGLHKGLTNRLMEPFLWMQCLLTGTDFQNFFSLRVHRDAHADFQHLAHMMLKAYLKSQPIQRGWDEWHIPFGDRMPDGIDEATRIKIAVARAARVSYQTMDGEIDVAKDIELHDRLVASGHMSPTEHVAVACKGRHGNFNGWTQYRQTLPNENRTCDLQKLLETYEEQLAIDKATAEGKTSPLPGSP
jgi:hypothetical protein